MIIEPQMFQQMRQTCWGFGIDKSALGPAEAAQRAVRAIDEATYHFNHSCGETVMEPRDMVYEVKDLLEQNRVLVQISWDPQVLDFELYDETLTNPKGYLGSVPHARHLRGPIFTWTPNGKLQFDRASWDTETRCWIFSYTRTIGFSLGGHDGTPY